MQFQDSRMGQAWVIEVGGRVDAAGAALLEAHCQQGLGRGETRLVVDLAGVDFMASAGLRALLSLAKKVKPKGKLVISGARGPVKEIFDLAGFTTILPICDTLEQAAGLVM
ncbi:MAG TPA: STAS domain-containing protein [Kiritimatiellia bacterium]|nr:STAS domain-containing protein [Kiritimatiellia bacterium]HRZ11352.1 STAS domain-containing protein [Kiritimatiellia bacterium]HSA17097.1 STAS domain-containing protein [Kiritimatiellia bacterium]